MSPRSTSACGNVSLCLKKYSVQTFTTYIAFWSPKVLEHSFFFPNFTVKCPCDPVSPWCATVVSERKGRAVEVKAMNPAVHCYFKKKRGG